MQAVNLQWNGKTFVSLPEMVFSILYFAIADLNPNDEPKI